MKKIEYNADKYILHDGSEGTKEQFFAEMKESDVKSWKERWYFVEDELSKYAKEDMYECDDWNVWMKLWEEVKKDGINVRSLIKKNKLKGQRKRNQNIEQLKPIKDIKEYTNDELKSLYKSYVTYCMTEYFIYRKRYVNDKNIDELDRKDIWGIDDWKIKDLEYKLDNEMYEDEKEKIKLAEEKLVSQTLIQIRFWFNGGIDEIENEDKIDELEFELHMNDDFNKEYGVATTYEVYKFIWETLRYCDIQTLYSLRKRADEKFKINAPYRPSKNKKIFKYDKDNNLVATYNNRNECIDVDKISKGALSNILSGRRKSNNGYYYIEED